MVTLTALIALAGVAQVYSQCPDITGMCFQSMKSQLLVVGGVRWSQSGLTGSNITISQKIILDVNLTVTSINIVSGGCSPSIVAY